MDLLQKAYNKIFKETGEQKNLSVPGEQNNTYPVYAIPLNLLYYNDQNGRINTLYKKYSARNGLLKPEVGDSEYNKIFEQFIYESNPEAMKETKKSIIEKNQQEPGVVLRDGRIIDGNRRFTALRMIERETGITQTFNAVILRLDPTTKYNEKTIKELELDLQLGREERVNYDPIDRIFDVYNTIEVRRIMTADEYKKASGAKTKKNINEDIRYAELIIKFIEIVSPGENPLDKFYLARDLKLDGPIREIGNTINKLKSKNKESIKEAALVYLATSKAVYDQADFPRLMRGLKDNVLKNNDRMQHFIEAVDNKVDIIMDAFEEKPIQSANDLKSIIEQDENILKSVNSLMRTTERIIDKGRIEDKRIKPLIQLENIRDLLSNIDAKDFDEMTIDENISAKSILSEINDILFKLKKDVL
ncbi:ParB/Srx family N-terminal domain-containing protein [uncultured Ezakiella sp.]|uniref:ParB/Srx family N-terminal domain-containing protein n=1 Tax=uncultured Ezakiella sp. TaxID=1637529 RepID=UPI0025F53E54|nr:ParB/Srx family N-terminal domain-containing protein [uncultured Ezakiella sp.]